MRLVLSSKSLNHADMLQVFFKFSSLYQAFGTYEQGKVAVSAVGNLPQLVFSDVEILCRFRQSQVGLFPDGYLFGFVVVQ